MVEKKIVLIILLALVLCSCVRTCPDCNTKLNKVEIVYGEVSADFMEKARKEGIPMGGCIISPESPKHALICPRCKKEIERI